MKYFLVQIRVKNQMHLLALKKLYYHSLKELREPILITSKLELLELLDKLRNLRKLPSVTASLISIFFNQIIYIVKKILKIK